MKYWSLGPAMLADPDELGIETTENVVDWLGPIETSARILNVAV